MPSEEAEKLIENRAELAIVLAVIKNDHNQVLIARRNDQTLPLAHNKWELVGGRLEWTESPEQAVIREAKEESGLDVSVVKLLPKIFHNYWTQIDGSEFKVLLLPYECREIGGQLHTTNFDHKIGELKYINFSEVNNYDYLPLTKEAIQLAYV